MSAIPRRPIPWDIYEEHLDEAAFLWGEWESAREGANYTIGEVATGPEERLRAHLDGLVLGGRAVAEKLLLPALQSDDLKLVRPAAWALLAAEDADHFDEVLAALAEADLPKGRAIARAMGLASHPSTVDRLAPLWTHGSTRLRALILDVVSLHDTSWAAAQLPEALRKGEPLLLAVALRLLRCLPDRDPIFHWYAEDGLTKLMTAVREEALATAYVFGSPKVWAACRDDIAEGRAGRTTYGLLALSPDPADRAILVKSLRVSSVRRHALWALGFAGDVAAADELIPFLANSRLAAMAAESLSAITGLPIEGRYRAAGVTRGPAEEEVGLDDPPPVVRPEDHLPPPDVVAVGEWWKKNRSRFQPNHRYLTGAPRTPEVLRGAMGAVPAWRRGIMALEIAACTQTPVPLGMSGWASAGAQVVFAGARTQSAARPPSSASSQASAPVSSA
jgi:uncharacterized protein (TIGR02270 family)